MKIGIAGDKVVSDKPLITTLLKQAKLEAWEIKVRKSIYIFWPKKIEFLRLPDVEQIKDCSIIHAVFPFHTFEVIILAKILRKKVIFHWIGTDVWYLLGSWMDDFKQKQYGHCFYKIFAKFLIFLADFHLCGSENLQKELASFGIKATIVPVLPLEMNFPPRSSRLPLAVLSYLPEERQKFYGSEIFFKLADAFPGVNFYALDMMSRRRKHKNSNVYYLAYQQDMNEIFKKIGLVYRLPEHDGMALMVLEGLLRGKQVIFSYKFPYCYYATNFSEAKKALEQFIRNPKINKEGAEFVKKNMSHEKVAKQLTEIYQQVLKR